MEYPLKFFLEDLASTNVVKVTGSYAAGKQREDSDIDFYIKEDKPDTPKEKRNILKVIKVLRHYNALLDSHTVGYIWTTNLPIQLEFSDLFTPRQDRLKSVEIKGIKFKTY